MTVASDGQAVAEDGGVIRAQLIGPGDMGRALFAVAPQFIELVRSIPADAAERQVPGMAWTAAEVAAHVLTVVRRGQGDDRRADTVADLGVLNQACVDEVAERDPVRLADLLAQAFATSATTTRDPDAPFALHAGVVADIATATSYLLADLLVHGVDIASATGQTWVVDPPAAAVALRGCLPAVAPWVRPEITAGSPFVVALDFGDGGPVVGLWFGGGGYRAGSASELEAVRTLVVPADQALLALSGRPRAHETAALAEIAGWFLPI